MRERIRRNALLLFSKPPLPGLVKTRLTPLKDGVFSPETAAALYHCMFFDVVEICCDALTDLENAALGDAGLIDTYDIIISTTPAENVEVMQKLFADSGVWPRELQIRADAGASFDEHYNDAFEQVWAQGYDTILSMGGDMPALPKSVVVEGFQQLHEIYDNDASQGAAGSTDDAFTDGAASSRGDASQGAAGSTDDAFADEAAGSTDDAPSRGGMVLSPDQEMGVSLVGWTRDTHMDHTGVFYNQDGLTVLPAYIEKARALNLPVRYLTAVPDVDTMADLAHNITLMQAIEYCAQFQDLSIPWRTIDALRQIGYFEVRVPPNELRDSREGIDRA